MDHMTAKMSCFARAFHYLHNRTWVFPDNVADKVLGEAEYREIAQSLIAGIVFFAPGFSGSDDDALRYIVDRQLSPSVLGRSAFNEYHLNNERRFGCNQYVQFAAGYDTYALRADSRGMRVFELDQPEMIADKKYRIDRYELETYADTSMIACNLAETSWKDLLINQGFRAEARTFGSLLGLSYYLPKEVFKKLLQNISELWSEGSSLCFDYPVMDECKESQKNRALAAAANEQMKARYTYSEIEALLSECGFLIYEHLDEEMMTEQYFSVYNQATPEHPLHAPKGVHYILATKKA